ncbi:MAG TPA: methyltransferase domain-containing protein [Rubricoccaceae bacterium]|jgi:SAM-dependent methyltransferase
MLPPDVFRRQDESDDADFYTQPRFVTHIDAAAVAAVTDLYRETVGAGADVLDLMTSHVSHLPEDVAYGRVAGLGMNAAELAANPALTERIVQNLNTDPRLPYADASFDAVLICVSVQYLTQPVEVFAEIARVLRPGSAERPGGALVVTFSNRCFPTKAVRAWAALGDAGHSALVGIYVREAGGFGEPDLRAHTPRGGDPLFSVVARRES